MDYLREAMIHFSRLIEGPFCGDSPMLHLASAFQAIFKIQKILKRFQSAVYQHYYNEPIGYRFG